MEILLTAKDLKAARVSLNLSQAKVAKEVNLNRSYLSQFESEQRLLKDDEKQAIYEYYLSMGLNEEIVQERPVEVLLAENEIQLIDGFQIPVNNDPFQTEDWLVQLNENEEELSKLFGVIDKSNLLFTDSKYEKAAERALLLMADNYVLIKYLQGFEDLLDCPNAESDEKSCRSELKQVLQGVSEAKGKAA